MPFLPVTAGEIIKAGYERPDFIVVTGDAYVDHPSFGAAIIGRVLGDRGFLTAVLPQPDWRDAKNFTVFGEPRLAFLVTAGNLDSMVNHYTAAKKRRGADAYSPGGRAGMRPDRAVTVYSNKIRETYKKTPIICGGLEASLRRLAHYDYWDDKVRRSVLMDSGADLLVYGMGERQIMEIARLLDAGVPVGEITNVKGTAYKTKNAGRIGEHITLPSFEEVAGDKRKYAESFMLQYNNMCHIRGKMLAEPYGGWSVVQNPPAVPLTTKEMDRVYRLPLERGCHPMYNQKIPAAQEIQFSITSSRGCFGGCSYCSLGFHQGCAVSARSHLSVMDEAKNFIRDPDFKGYIHDVGGPTANFRRPPCEKQVKEGCSDKRCLHPKPCKNLDASHTDYLSLLKKLRGMPGIKKVFIRSGIRYDYLLLDKTSGFLNEMCANHVSGQLKVAPEHVSAKVLDLMGKPPVEVYEKFKVAFMKASAEAGLEQYLTPYFMSGHPGCELTDAVELAEYIRDRRVMPEQVQDFYPTPGTLSTCMYYTETDPRTGRRLYVAKNAREKAMQRALIQYGLARNYNLVKEALVRAGREDLIGYSKKCLIRPRPSGGTRRNNPISTGSPRR